MNAEPPEQGSPFLRVYVWLVYACLFGISIPWYWPKAEITLWAGVPVWVIVTLLSSLAISCFTAWLLLYRWPEDPIAEGKRDE